MANYYVKTAYTDCQVIKEIPTGEQYAIAVSKDSPELTKALNKALKAVRENGKYDELAAKWLAVTHQDRVTHADRIRIRAETPRRRRGGSVRRGACASRSSCRSERTRSTWSAGPPSRTRTAINTTVLGATATRVTWQGQTAEDESLAGVAIELPEGTDRRGREREDHRARGARSPRCGVRGASWTAIDGHGDARRACAGRLRSSWWSATARSCRAAAGSFGLAGSYTTADGQRHDMPATDQVINVSSTSPAEQLSSWLGQQDWVKAWNSNKFLHLFFDPAIIVTSVPALFAGWLVSIGVVVVSFPLAIPLGLLLSFLRMAKHRLPRAIGATYINIVRGTPLFLQLYIAFFGLPLMGVQMDNFTMGAIVLVMNSSAYLAEIFRAGIQSISQGQFEAARSLGMNGAQTMFFVIIPQTVRRVIPTMTSEFILMYKDTSLLAAVGVTELMMYAKTITAATGNVTPYIVAAGLLPHRHHSASRSSSTPMEAAHGQRAPQA